MAVCNAGVALMVEKMVGKFLAVPLNQNSFSCEMAVYNGGF